MIERPVSYTVTDEKTIERIIEDENVAINHMILNQGEALPTHNANSNVYMIVVRGEISLSLGEQDTHSYPKGNIVCIPHKTHMRVFNAGTETTEIFVIKAPSPLTIAQ